MIAGTHPINREADLGVGSMHGSGPHLRRDGHIADYAPLRVGSRCPVLLERKRKRGFHRDQQSARAMANKAMMALWEGVLACSNHTVVSS